MDKLKTIKKIADYIRVNGSLAPISIQDLFRLLSNCSYTSLSKSDIGTILQALIDLKLIAESYSAEPQGTRQFLWIGEE